MAIDLRRDDYVDLRDDQDGYRYPPVLIDLEDMVFDFQPEQVTVTTPRSSTALIKAGGVLACVGFILWLFE